MKRFIQEVLGGLSIAGLYLLMPSGEGVALAFPIAAVAAIAGVGVQLLGNKAASNAAKQADTYYNRRTNISTLGADVNKMLAQIRELQSQGSIPGFQSAAATANARSGLTGTGLGNALSTAAGGAGEMDALRQAIQAALAFRGMTAGIDPPTGQSQLGLANAATGLSGLQGGLLSMLERRNAFNENAMNLPGQPVPGTVPNIPTTPPGLPFGADFNFPTGK